ncbi:flavin reductase family protein [Amycolatopsis sp. FDAARGOS 1241]|uniref:flavin reductase family protein n=1 Tax=Amycolatopsis sp. FDAARGOS 1241 TaxID=2778070 RepID=UPI00194F0425|nr:flavin reductase family protein [Amycolatopsis sp. FDAARGOS 1241]QRP50030.1 flavin reductase [Amycolatopsis sp. FDAARGOS 1241]
MTVTTGPAGVDGELFREAMAGVCAPVSVVTTLHEGRPHGTTVSAFAALSADRPLVSVAPDSGSRLLARVHATGRIGGQRADAGALGPRAELREQGGGQVRGRRLDPRRRAPTAARAGWLACTVADLVPVGDHVVTFAPVTSAAPRPAEPLTYHNRAFGTHLPEEARS